MDFSGKSSFSVHITLTIMVKTATLAIIPRVKKEYMKMTTILATDDHMVVQNYLKKRNKFFRGKQRPKLKLCCLFTTDVIERVKKSRKCCQIL
uniref:Uncharacterized protein n=1 Tax=Romanomermis culicivorax TaxID=13658 RepID=A0A915I8N6_ROMCU